MTNPVRMTGTRTRVTLAAAVLLAASPAVASAAASPVLVLTGSRSASVVVTFARPVTVFYGDPRYGERGPTITGGDPAGFVLARLDGFVLAGAVATTKASMDGTRTLVGPDDNKIQLPRGTYRLTLVASGQTTVSIPVDGLRASVTYRPTTPVTVKSFDVPVLGASGVALPASPSSVARGTVTLGARTVVIGAFRHNMTGNGETTTFCVTPVGGGCPNGAIYVQSADSTLGGPPQVAQPTGSLAMVVSGMVGKGRYDIVWTVQTKGIGSDEHATLITIG